MEKKLRKYHQGLAIEADKILQEELIKINEGFDFFEPVCITKEGLGVQGDKRVYGYPVEVTFEGIKKEGSDLYREIEFY